MHIIDKNDEIIMQYFINMHADTLVPVYVHKCKHLTVFVYVFQTVFKKLVKKLKYTIDLHRSKPVISLVPFNPHFHCFQGYGHCYMTIPIVFPANQKQSFK